MTNARAETTADAGPMHDRSRRFAKVFENPDTAEDVLAVDVFFDLNMPVWRMQLQGAAAFAAQLRQIYDGDVRIDVLRTVATETGFVTEHEEHQSVNGRDLTARRLWLCRVGDGAIIEAVGYCSGEWDEELRARHAAEAPMIRP
jgi:ketosteroid isomerase-like protein